MSLTARRLAGDEAGRFGAVRDAFEAAQSAFAPEQCRGKALSAGAGVAVLPTLSTINTINQTAPRRFRSEAFFLQLLSKAVAANARDVHLKVGQPPGARVRGEIVYFRLRQVNGLGHARRRHSLDS